MNGLSWTPTGYRTRRSFSVTAVLLALLVFVNSSLSRPAKAQQPSGQKGEVTVAAAADMQPVLGYFGPIFEKKYNVKLNVSYASSATLAEQIRNGSPADIFFSADYYFAEQVIADKLSVDTSPKPYAKGILVLYTRNDSRFKPLTIDALSRKDLKSVAIANPDRAPYGRAAVAALKHMKLWDNVAPHIVQAESVAQAAQFALSGNAELALMSRTTALSGKYKAEGNFIIVPLDQYPPINQTAVILKNGKNHEGAHQLLNFILSDQVQQTLPELGLQPAAQ